MRISDIKSFLFLGGGGVGVGGGVEGQEAELSGMRWCPMNIHFQLIVENLKFKMVIIIMIIIIIIITIIIIIAIIITSITTTIII